MSRHSPSASILDEQASSRFVPSYFDSDIESGIPKLTEAGRQAIEEEMKEEALYPLEDA